MLPYIIEKLVENKSTSTYMHLYIGVQEIIL